MNPKKPNCKICDKNGSTYGVSEGTSFEKTLPNRWDEDGTYHEQGIVKINGYRCTNDHYWELQVK